MLIDAAVRIHCFDKDVTLEALTVNGERLLQTLAQSLPSSLITLSSQTLLTLHFPEINQDLDEDSRLRELSSFDALRFIQNHFDVTGLPSNALFLGGLFAYDLVANFENLGNAETTNKCPDYVFYVAESLLVIDHQTESSVLQGSLFNSDEAIKSSVSDRLIEIKEFCSEPHTVPAAPTLKISVKPY
jgi:anthranilate synthase component 1